MNRERMTNPKCLGRASQTLLVQEVPILRGGK